MASSAHPAFPSRQYPSNLGKLPDRSLGTTFGASSAQQKREHERAERERERLEQERIAREEQNQLSEEQREEIKEAVSQLLPAPNKGYVGQNTRKGDSIATIADRPAQFNLFDLDKDQKIDYHELKVAMKALGFDIPKSEILSILQTHGHQSQPPSSNPSVLHHPRLLIDLAHFQTVMTQKILARDPREEILRAFELFDEGGKGKINLNDLRRVARELGEGLEEEELLAMIEEFDLDGDGAINREEFLSICLQ